MGLLIKCRRLPRDFFWNTSLPPLFIGCSTIGKVNVMINYGISRRRYAEITFKKPVFMRLSEFHNYLKKENERNIYSNIVYR